MTYEEALFYKIMLRAGDSELYFKWIEEKMNTEDPMEEETVELAFCGIDTNKVISYLHNYCLGQEINKECVLDTIWKTLHIYYIEQKYTMENMLTLMERISSVLEDEEFPLDEPAYTMYSMWYLCEEAEAGIISMDSFRKVYEDFLLNKAEITEQRGEVKTLRYVKIVKMLLAIYAIGYILICLLFILFNIFDNEMLENIVISIIKFNESGFITWLLLVASGMGMICYWRERKQDDYKTVIGRKWLWLVGSIIIQGVIFGVCILAFAVLTSIFLGGV